MSAVLFPRQAYYERIGAAKALLPLLAPQGTQVQVGSPSVNMQFLQQLILAHTSAIPFETIDVLLGRRVSVAPVDIYDKLIHARRGGYCFEQNGLFYEALRDAGFTDVRPVAARVLWDGENSPLGRTHRLNIVTLPAEDDATGSGTRQWMVDVGFGAGVPRAPLRLDTAEPQQTIAGVMRVRTRNPVPELTGGWSENVVELQVEGGGWRPLYHFDLQPQWLRDIYMMNFVVYQESLFRGCVQAARAEGTWVRTPTPAEKDSAHAVVSATGYTFVPRGVYSVVARSDKCTTAAKPAFLVPDAALALLPGVGGVLPSAQSHPATPGELYDWMKEKLQIDFQQTRLPQYSVSRDEFERAARDRLEVFGGSGFQSPHNF
ncbi:N-hydroxyarylamine O-acetyltransferase [Leptomonas pyrrhocoris]|uniref:N-hydroxyarylamine O-acetyltransferase n=1 Tax=Leptomonas pyrrhocoris TaxID=157538 RepID=A0A0M9FWX9_LEPPY|nr:N-hydroxyarylamine O-acetyltransferase [Leptomonas pyrrhocoris]KPA77663.1 N-hydroxyarylamine O-acetyltransferase [Leptomonas pyrrhocoris]|eukprot:XP_015656102.1 N-hydroxyarylamine O-acetyltransferase [Leptomonas pyrrhocoris]